MPVHLPGSSSSGVSVNCHNLFTKSHTHCFSLFPSSPPPGHHHWTPRPRLTSASSFLLSNKHIHSYWGWGKCLPWLYWPFSGLTSYTADCLPLNWPTSFGPSQYSQLSVCISRQFQRRWFPPPLPPGMEGARGQSQNWSPDQFVVILHVPPIILKNWVPSHIFKLTSKILHYQF